MKVYSLLTLGLLTLSCFGQYEDSLSARWKRTLAHAKSPEYAAKKQKEFDEEYRKHSTDYNLATAGLLLGGMSRSLLGSNPLTGPVIAVSTAPLLLRYYNNNVMTPKRIKAFKKRTPTYNYFTLGDTY